MRLPALAILAFAAACGSAGLNGSQGTNVNLESSGNATLRLAGSDGPHMDTITSPIEQVFRTMPAIFDSLGIPVTELNPAMHTIGNPALKIRRQLGSTSLAKLLDCGNTQGFPSAETYDIQMSIRTQLQSVPGGGTAISTLVEAVGRPVAFAGEYVRCSTRGTLERTLFDAIRGHAH